MRQATEPFEQRVLGYLLAFPAERVLEVELKPEHFRSPRYRRLYETIVKAVCLEGRRGVLDPAVVYHEVNQCEPGTIAGNARLTFDQMAELVEVGFDAGIDFQRNAAILREMAVREAMEHHAEIVKTGLEDGTMTSEQAMDETEVMRKRYLEEQVFVQETVRELLPEHVLTLKKRRAAASVRSGFVRFDAMADGFPIGGLSVVGARTGRGKSAFLQTVAEYAARRLQPVLFVSPEMRREEMLDRTLARACSLALDRIRQGDLSAEEIAALDAVIANGNDLGLLTIDDRRGVTVAQIEAEATKRKNSTGLTMVVVDYLQLVQLKPHPGELRYQVLQRVAQRLKDLAGTLEVAMVVGAQLGRPADEQAPELRDLRESGDIEQTADLVLFLTPPRVGDGYVEVKVAKHRQGRVSSFVLTWEPEFTRFGNP